MLTYLCNKAHANYKMDLEIAKLKRSLWITQLNEHIQAVWLDVVDLHHLDWAEADIPVIPEIENYLLSKRSGRVKLEVRHKPPN